MFTPTVRYNDRLHFVYESAPAVDENTKPRYGKYTGVCIVY
jgi:hypothetical protein